MQEGGYVTYYVDEEAMCRYNEDVSSGARFSRSRSPSTAVRGSLAEFSKQSDRQLRLIQEMNETRIKHEREQAKVMNAVQEAMGGIREAMGGLLSRMENSETNIAELKHFTETLSQNQKQMQRDFRLYKDELSALKDYVGFQQQPRHGTTASSSNSSTTTTPPPTTSFKDVYGRSKLTVV